MSKRENKTEQNSKRVAWKLLLSPAESKPQFPFIGRAYVLSTTSDMLHI